MHLTNCHLFSLAFLYSIGFLACNNADPEIEITPAKKVSNINTLGTTVQTRYNLPEGFTREIYDSTSFQDYLSNLPLKPYGTEVRYYNGDIKPSKGIYNAVIDLPISNRNLQQCADAVIRLRAEYLYKTKQFDQIQFNFTNGFKASYSEWMKGKRIVVNGNSVTWAKKSEPSNTYQNFRDYLEVVFTYAGTLSLSQELKKTDMNQIKPGDVFIRGGSPGHAVIAVDVAQNSKTNQKIFILAQSYMPAQEIQVLVNNNDTDYNPWYKVSNSEEIETPEWIFNKNELMKF